MKRDPRQVSFRTELALVERIDAALQALSPLVPITRTQGLVALVTWALDNHPALNEQVK